MDNQVAKSVCTSLQIETTFCDKSGMSIDKKLKELGLYS